MSKDKKTKKNYSEKIKKAFKKEKKCDHKDFWTLYKIINFHRNSLKGECGKCGKKIELEYLGHDAMKGNLWIRAFSCILWMTPAIFIIFLAVLFGDIYGVWIYIIAIIDIILFHFWAMYYMIAGGLITVKKK